MVMVCVTRFVGQAGAAVVSGKVATVPAPRQAVVEAEKKVVNSVGLVPVEIILARSAPKDTKTPAFAFDLCRYGYAVVRCCETLREDNLGDVDEGSCRAWKGVLRKEDRGS